jgi:hypothetical protein
MYSRSIRVCDVETTETSVDHVYRGESESESASDREEGEDGNDWETQLDLVGDKGGGQQEDQSESGRWDGERQGREVCETELEGGKACQ